MSASILSKVEEYLDSNVDDSIKTFADLPPASDIPNIDKACDRFISALAKNEKIYYVHDSDADGVGSAALAHRSIRDLGYSAYHYITKRSDGYGFLPLHVDDAKKHGANLIITTDNGITSYEACEYARKLGIDVIITDHHQPEKDHLPNALIVNPQLLDADHKLKDLSGTSVYWYFLKRLTETSSVTLDIQSYLEELTLTTISDMMPLRHVNRFFVKTGLTYFNDKLRRPYAAVIKNNNKYDPKIKAETIAFSLAPLINAANRFDEAEKAYEFLMSSSAEEAQMWFTYLNNLNEKRKDVTQMYTQLVSTSPIIYGRLVFVILNNAQKGLLGLLANKLAQQYNRPALVVTSTEDEIVEGSGRSVGRINMLEILKKSKLCTVGGHKQAFGIKIDKQNISELIKFVNQEMSKLPHTHYIEPDESFMDITFADITQALYDLINMYEPYGIGFKKPIFGADVEVIKTYRFGKQSNHTKFILKDIEGNQTEMVNFFNSKSYKPGQIIRINFTIEFDTYLNSPVGRIYKIVQGAA